LSLLPEDKRAWWQEPMVWLIMVLPLSAVLGGLTSVWIASKNADSLVTEGYTKQGFTVQQSLEQDRVAARLGFTAHLQTVNGTVNVRLTHTRADAALPSRLHLTLAHPTEASMDVTVVMLPAGSDLYQGAMPTLPAGVRHVMLEAREQGWRLQGNWDTPFKGILELVPPSTNM
jgi:uncharacterized protein